MEVCINEKIICVHAFIGKLVDGTIATYQTLPWNYRGWHGDSGSKGSVNDSYISFEICEDGLSDSTYFDKVYRLILNSLILISIHQGSNNKCFVHFLAVMITYNLTCANVQNGGEISPTVLDCMDICNRYFWLSSTPYIKVLHYDG